MSEIKKIVIVPPAIRLKYYWKLNDKEQVDVSQNGSHVSNASKGMNTSPKSSIVSPGSVTSNTTKKKRASLTQQLVRSLSWTWGKKDTQIEDQKKERYEKMHTWFPDRLLKNHYCDGFNSQWVLYNPEEDDDDEEENIYGIDERSRKVLRAAASDMSKENYEIYIKKDVPHLFFVKVLKKQLAFDDNFEISHAIWSVDKVLDPEAWNRIEAQLKESQQKQTGMNNSHAILLDELLKIARQDIDFRNLYKEDSNMPATYSIIDSFVSYLKKYRPLFLNSMNTKIDTLRKNLIITTDELDLTFMKSRIDFLHHRLLQELLEDLKLRFSNSSSGFQDWEDVLNEDEENVCLEFLSNAMRSFVEMELNQKIFNGKWETKFALNDEAFRKACEKCKGYTLQQLGMEVKDLSVYKYNQEEAVSLFKQISTLSTSYQKLLQLKLCIDCIMRSIEVHQVSLLKNNKKSNINFKIELITSDQLIPILEEVIIQASPIDMDKNFNYIDIMKSEELDMTEMGYAFVSFHAAIEYIKSLASSMEDDTKPKIQNRRSQKSEKKSFQSYPRKQLKNGRMPITIDPNASEKRQVEIGSFLQGILNNADID